MNKALISEGKIHIRDYNCYAPSYGCLKKDGTQMSYVTGTSGGSKANIFPACWIKVD